MNYSAMDGDILDFFSAVVDLTTEIRTDELRC